MPSQTSFFSESSRSKRPPGSPYRTRLGALIALAVLSSAHCWGQDMGFARPLEHDETAVAVGTYSEGTIYFEDLRDFSLSITKDWPDAVEQLLEGYPTKMEEVFEAYALMQWCYDHALAWGTYNKPEWIERQQRMLERVVKSTTRNIILAGFDRRVAEEKAARESQALFQEYWNARRITYQVIYLDTASAFLRAASDEEYAAAKAKRLTLAKKILQWLDEGDEWNELAVRFSDLRGEPVKVYGPRIVGSPRVMAHEMNPEVAKVLLGMEPGDVSDIVETRFGYVILRVLGKESVDPPPDLEEKTLARIMAEEEQRYLENWLDSQRGNFEIITRPELLHDTTASATEAIAEVRVKGSDAPPLQYTVGEHRRAFEDPPPSVTAQIFSNPNFFEEDLKENILPSLMVTAHGFSLGLYREPRYRRLALFGWRAHLAKETMKRMAEETVAQIPIPENELTAHYQDNQARYTTAPAVKTRLVDISVTIDQARLNEGTRGFFRKITGQISREILIKLRAGAPFEEAVASVWGGPDTTGRVISRRALEFVGEDSGVLSFDLRASSEPAALNRQALTNQYRVHQQVETVLGAQPGALLGPLHYLRSEPGGGPFHEGVLVIQILERIPARLQPFEEVRDQVEEDVRSSVYYGMVFAGLQRDYLREASIQINYDQLLDILQAEPSE